MATRVLSYADEVFSGKRKYLLESFDLDHANQAVAHAAANSGPFRMTVIRP